MSRIIAEISYKVTNPEVTRTIAAQFTDLQKRADELRKAILSATDVQTKGTLTSELKRVQGQMESLNTATRGAVGLINNLESELSKLNFSKGLAATEGDLKAINKEIANTQKELNRLNGIADNAPKESIFGSVIGGSLVAQGISAASGSLLDFGGKVISARAEFQKFEAILSTQLGSDKLAQNALGEATKLATALPVELGEVVDAFIKLDNGTNFDKSKREVIAFTDIASSRGKSLSQFSEAVLDAQTGEFERLKEFGIKASKSGNEVALSFRGVTQTVKNDAESIRAALVGIGEGEGIKGSAAKIAKTLTGQISNLKDSLNQLLNDIGAGTEGAIVAVIGKVSDLINFLRELPEIYQRNITVIQTTAEIVAALAAAYAAYQLTVKGGIAIDLAYNATIQIGNALKVAQIALTEGLAVAETSAAAATEGGTAAMAAFNVVMELNPIGLVIAALAALAIGFYAFSNSTSDATKRLEALNAVKERVAENTAKERASLESLLVVAKDENASKEARIAAIKKLNELSPEYLGSLTLEKIGTNEATTAIDLYIKAMERKARTEAISSEFTQLFTQKFAIERKRDAEIAALPASIARPKRESETIKGAGGGVYDVVATGNKVVGASDAADPVEAIKGKYDNALYQIRQQMDDLNKYSAEFAGAVEGTQKKAAATGAAVDKKTIDDRKKFLEGAYKSIRELIEKENDTTDKLLNATDRPSLAKINTDISTERKAALRDVAEKEAAFKKDLSEKGIAANDPAAKKILNEYTELALATGKRFDQQRLNDIKKYTDDARAAVVANEIKTQEAVIGADITALETRGNNELAARESIIEKQLTLELLKNEAARKLELKGIETIAQQRADIYGTNFSAEAAKLADDINAKFDAAAINATAKASKATAEAVFNQISANIDAEKILQTGAEQSAKQLNDAALVSLNEKYATGLIGEQQYQDAKTELLRRAERERLTIAATGVSNQITKIDAQSGDTALTPEMRAKLAAQRKALETELSNITVKITDIEIDEKEVAKKKREEIIKKAEDAYTSLASAAEDANKRIAESEAKKYDAMINAQKARVDAAEKIAGKGNAKQLQLERDRLRALTAEKERAALREQRINNALAASNYALAIAKGVQAIATQANELFPLNVIAIAATVGGLLAGGISLATAIGNTAAQSRAIDGFSKGGYTGGGHSSDVVGVVHGKEFVFDAKTTAENRQFFDTLHGTGNLQKTLSLMPNLQGITQHYTDDKQMIVNANLHGLQPLAKELRRSNDRLDYHTERQELQRDRESRRHKDGTTTTPSRNAWYL